MDIPEFVSGILVRCNRGFGSWSASFKLHLFDINSSFVSTNQGCYGHEVFELSTGMHVEIMYGFGYGYGYEIISDNRDVYK